MYLALEAKVVWNSFCVVTLSVLYPVTFLFWQTLEHRNDRVSAEVVIALLKRVNPLLQGINAITVMENRAFPSDKLLD